MKIDLKEEYTLSFSQGTPEDNSNKVEPSKEEKDKNQKPNYFWMVAILLLLVGFAFFLQKLDSVPDIQEKSQLDFENSFRMGHVRQLVVVGKYVEVFLIADSAALPMYKTKDKNTPFAKTNKDRPHYWFSIASPSLLKQNMDVLQRENPKITKVPITFEDRASAWSGVMSILPYVLFFVVWIFILRRMGGGGGFPGGQIFNIGKSRAKLFDDAKVMPITFADVAGLDEEKLEVMEIVSFLKEPKKYTNLGGKIPKGALLIGPPGTGKTLLAKAMAGEAKVPFFSISGSDFVEMFVGVGASRVRDMFNQAREKAPCIVFIDEIDAIGRARGRNMVNNNDERENTLNQLLVEMDGFSSEKGVIMLAATNRPDVLDDALLRPGRFDRQISIDRPDIKGREQIFNVHLKPIKVKPEEIDTHKLAAQTPGFVGADIANVCNEAALIAARNNKSYVEMEDFNAAIDRVIGGLEKRNTIIQPNEKKTVAYHEAGHAICGWYLEHADPLVKVSIVPRGIAALGYAQYLPKEKFLTVKEELQDRICMALGGRAAEDIIFGKISTGALSDLDSVTKIAYSMVTIYGMNEKVGNVSFYKLAENSYEKPYSQQTAEIIDQEVRSLIDIEYKRAKKLLSEKRDEMELLAKLLLEKEVLFKDDLEKLLGRRPIEITEEAEKNTEDEAQKKIDEAKNIKEEESNIS